MGNNNNNMGITWAQQYNKGLSLIKIRGRTSSIGNSHCMPCCYAQGPWDIL